MIARDTILGTATALALAAFVTPAAAQTPEDGRWLPWLGCWVEAGAPADAPMVCVRGADAGVELLSVARTGVTDQEHVRADGTERSVRESGCTGTRSAEFSADGARVYRTEALTCEGTSRTTHEILAMVEPGAWIRIRSVELPGDDAVFVTRYQEAPPARVAAAGLEDLQAEVDAVRLAVETARMAASVPLQVDDILEAHTRAPAEAVAALVSEDGGSLRVDRDDLVRLADAGVSPKIIDVAIAVSYPERFALAHEPRARDPYMDPHPWPMWGYGWGGYPWYSAYGSWGYPYGFGSRYGWYRYGYRPTVVVVRPIDEDDGQGRAVRGQGYTRGGNGAATTGRIHRPSQPSASRGSGFSGGSKAAGSSSSGSKGKAKKKGS